MADQKDQAGIGAEFGRVAPRPADSSRAVLDEVGEADVGVEAIIRDDRDDAALGEGHRREAIVRLGPVFPTASVEEHGHRRLGAMRHTLARLVLGIDIEKATPPVGEADVARDRHGTAERRRVDEPQSTDRLRPSHKSLSRQSPSETHRADPASRTIRSPYAATRQKVRAASSPKTPCTPYIV